MKRVISTHDARMKGDKLVEHCRQIRDEDWQLGREPDDDLVVWFATQVGSFGLYIRTLAQEEGRTGNTYDLVDQMVDEIESLSRYCMARAIQPDVPREELFSHSHGVIPDQELLGPPTA